MDMPTGSEVFQVAAEIEDTSRVFYENLAHAAHSEEISAVCRKLAAQEQSHQRLFLRMHENYGRNWPTRKMSAGELAAAETEVRHQIIPDPKQVRQVALRGTAADALDMAIGMEDSAVRFYSSLLPGTAGADADAIRMIIREEIEHKKTLTYLRGNL